MLDVWCSSISSASNRKSRRIHFVVVIKTVSSASAPTTRKKTQCVCFCPILTRLSFGRQMFVKTHHLKFQRIRPVGVHLFHSDEHTDMSKLAFSSRKCYANVHKTYYKEIVFVDWINHVNAVLSLWYSRIASTKSPSFSMTTCIASLTNLTIATAT